MKVTHYKVDPDLRKKLNKCFGKMGRERGSKIVALAKRVHPDALLILPLYRGAMVIPPQKKQFKDGGSVQIICYHDPEWLGGEEASVKNLRWFKQEVLLHGQRSRVDVAVDGLRMEHLEVWHDEMEWDRACSESGGKAKSREKAHDKRQRVEGKKLFAKFKKEA